MALDNKYHQLTDFGGSAKSKETAVQTALREFHEETLDIFQPLDVEDVQYSLVLHDHKTNLIIFVRTDLSPDNISCRYLLACNRLKASRRTYVENCAMTWLSLEDLQRLVASDNVSIFSRVRSFLQQAGNFYSYL